MSFIIFCLTERKDEQLPFSFHYLYFLSHEHFTSFFQVPSIPQEVEQREEMSSLYLGVGNSFYFLLPITFFYMYIFLFFSNALKPSRSRPKSIDVHFTSKRQHLPLLFTTCSLSNLHVHFISYS